jgi:hypothetical protein
MNYNEKLDNIGVSNLPYRAKVSEFRNNTWNFIDPETFPWKRVDDYLSYYQPTTKLGIILSTYFLPDQYVEVVNPGEYILRDTSASFTVYLKKPEDLVL